jgi:3-oxoisoapionate decarboxylase
VGSCLDSGNPVWALEDPHLTLETLAPYVVTSHVRDSTVWLTPQGATAAWTRMGEGTMGMEDYIREFAAKCPGRPLSLEVIVGNSRNLNFKDPKFWDAYRSTPAWEFQRYLALAERGKPYATPPRLTGAAAAARELEDVEASIQWTKKFLATL